MDVGDEMCWWQLEDIVDGFHQLGHLYSFLHERKLQSVEVHNGLAIRIWCFKYSKGLFLRY